VTEIPKRPLVVLFLIADVDQPLVHPKDKEELEQTSECVYKVPCPNCEKTYVGETWLVVLPCGCGLPS